ncbi:MAG: mannan-binding lectin [Methylococcales bacterium]|nr:mannan-binding lectin [Methylococcales bacterium]
MMKKLIQMAVVVFIVLATGGISQATDIKAGPIYNQNDAKGKCPNVCSRSGLQWNGNWKTIPTYDPGGMSVCGCDSPTNSPKKFDCEERKNQCLDSCPDIERRGMHAVIAACHIRCLEHYCSCLGLSGGVNGCR